MSEGVVLLQAAVDRLLDEDPVELPGPAALERLRVLLGCTERLHAAQLTAVRDLDRRELYALDAAGSARTWLRRQPGGEDGQVTLARRLAVRPGVAAALADARIGLRSATQLLTALEHVPRDLDDTLITAVVQDGIGRLLLEHTGGTPEDPAAAAAVLAKRAADQAVLTACVADQTAAPAARMEPAFVLLAERLPAAQLASALRLLLDPLQPDGTDQPPADPYYLELRVLADGDVDLRGLLDPETGQSLAAEIERRLDAARTAAAKARRAAATDGPDAHRMDIGGADAERHDADRPDAHRPEALADLPSDQDEPATAGSADRTEDTDNDLPGNDLSGNDLHDDDPTDDDPTDDGQTDEDDPLLEWDRAMADADTRAARRAARPGGDLGRADRSADAPPRLTSLGRRRHDVLRDLLTDATTTAPGEPVAAHVTVIATLEAVEGRLGALPAQLVLADGRTTALSAETLHRLGCNSTLDAVLLDAHGTPVGASSTRRMPNRRERRALRARWGPTCAVAGCSRSRTVPHHVVPWWLSHLTRLPDLVPLCTSCHHDLHEGHRTLRLRDHRLIDDHGWVTERTAAA